MSWSLIQTATAGQVGSGNTSVAAAFSSSVTAGDLVVVGFIGYGSSPGSVTDSAGNTYLQAAYQGGSNWAAVYYSLVKTGGVLTVTGTSVASSILSIGAQEWSFASGATISLDGTAAKASGSVLAAGSLGPVNVSGNDLLITSMSNSGTNTVSYTAGSGFTLAYDAHAAWNLQPIGSLYAANVTTSQTPTWTLSTAEYWVGAAATFSELVPGALTFSWRPAVDRSNSRRILWAD
jgi:hypothetical protein